MCHDCCKPEIEAYYISDDIYPIQLPLDNLPELGDNPETDIFGYILITSNQEITIITDQEGYDDWIKNHEGLNVVDT